MGDVGNVGEDAGTGREGQTGPDGATGAAGPTEAATLADGRVVHRLVLGAAPGPVLPLLTLGATVDRLEVSCGDGERRNIALGHAEPADHLASTTYLGAVVGRYANSIAGGRFVLYVV